MFTDPRTRSALALFVSLVGLLAWPASAGRSTTTVGLRPLVLQLDQRFANQLGSALTVDHRLLPWLAVEGLVQLDWLSSESEFTSDLLNLRLEPTPGESVRLPMALQAGLRLTPLAGPLLRPNEAWQPHVELAFSLGLGVALSQLDLAPKRDTVPALTASAGVRPYGYGAFEVRLQVVKTVWVGVSLSARGYSNEVNALNGCNLDDFRSLNGAQSAGISLSAVEVSSGCSPSAFGDDAAQKRAVPLGRFLLSYPESGFSVQTQLGLGVGFVL